MPLSCKYCGETWHDVMLRSCEQSHTHPLLLQGASDKITTWPSPQKISQRRLSCQTAHHLQRYKCNLYHVMQSGSGTYSSKTIYSVSIVSYMSSIRIIHGCYNVWIRVKTSNRLLSSHVSLI